MFEVGRLCVKLAGRDARKKCVVVDIVDDTFVLIDGQTRRRKCNTRHLEPLTKVLKIKKGASHSEVVDSLKKEGIEVVETKPKSKAAKPKKTKAPKKAKAPATVKPKKKVEEKKPAHEKEPESKKVEKVEKKAEPKKDAKPKEEKKPVKKSSKK